MDKYKQNFKSTMSSVVVRQIPNCNLPSIYNCLASPYND
jgi:hypothetical protein